MVVVLGFIGITNLPSLLGPRMVDVTVNFPFDHGVDGIQHGTKIFLGGIQIGQVSEITFVPEVDDVAPFFQVICQFDAKIVVPRTATIQVNSSPIGGDASLVVQLPVASGEMRVGPDEALVAAPNLSTLQLLFGVSRADSLERSIKKIEGVDLKTIARDGSTRLSVAADQARAIKVSLATDWEAWAPQADAIAKGYDTASEEWNRILTLFAAGQPLEIAKLEPAFDRIKLSLSSSAELVSTLRTRWQDQILPPLSDLIARFKHDCAIITDDYKLVLELIDQTKNAADESRADLQIAGNQLERAVREITLMPWTLLGGAIESKSESAEFNKIARELVRSATELRMAVNISKELLERDPKLAVRYPELVDLMKRWLERASAQQEVAGQAILDRLIGPPER